MKLKTITYLLKAGFYEDLKLTDKAAYKKRKKDFRFLKSVFGKKARIISRPRIMGIAPDYLVLKGHFAFIVDFSGLNFGDILSFRNFLRPVIHSVDEKIVVFDPVVVRKKRIAFPGVFVLDRSELKKVFSPLKKFNDEAPSCGELNLLWQK